MMDSKVPTSSSIKESTQQEDVLQCIITKDKNSQELGESTNICTTPASDIEAPLSPVLTSSKHSFRHIARRKSRIKLLSKFSQNSAVSQDTFTPLQTQTQVEEQSLQTQTQAAETEQIVTNNVKQFVEIPVVTAEEDTPEVKKSEDNKLAERLRRCIEMQRNKKFCYSIAASSSKLSSTSEDLESNDTFCDNLKSFVSNLNDTNYKNKNDFNFKIPESPVSLSKSKKCGNVKARTEIMTTNLETNIRVGFETGSGKKINLSEKALKRASKLFDDIIDVPCDNKNENSFDNNENVSNVGFKTASGNTLKLSDTSMNKIKTLFDDIFDLSNYKDIEDENMVKALPDAEVKLSGSYNQEKENMFDGSSKTIQNIKLSTKKIAANDKIQFKIPIQSVDNKSINKSNEEMSSDSKNLPFTQITDTQMCWAAENAECLSEFMTSQWTPSPKDKSSQSQETQHSNEKNINKTSDDYDEFSSQESEQLFGNLTVCEGGTVASRNNNQLDTISIDKNNDMPSFEFGTTSEKDLSISKAGNIFHDCDIAESNNGKNSETASGKSILFSEESLKKTKIMFEDCDITEENVDTNIDNPKNASSSVGFATASGKKVISEDSLRKVKNMFQDCDLTDENFDTPKNALPIGFETASEKKVAISEDSLRKPKNIFKDYDNTEGNLDKNMPTNEPSFGFATASVKSILFSEESLKKAKTIFLDSDNFENNPNLNTPESALYEAVSENNVRIPEEEQNKSRTQFENTLETNNEISQQLLMTQEQKLEESVAALTSVQTGFLTASGNKIVISENVLNKARKFFEDSSRLFEENFEEEMQFDFATPFTSINVPEYSTANNKSEINEIYPRLLTEHNISNYTANIPEEEVDFSDCCGFTWDESLKSFKIWELYKRSFKYIEKDLKDTVFYPLIFTFNDIQSSKDYKKKNYKYALRYRKKTSVAYGISKRKSITNSQKAPEILNTSSRVTRSKRNLAEVNTSLIGSSVPKTRSRTRKSKDNASNDSNNSSISNENHEPKVESNSNINKSTVDVKKTTEELEDAFLSCIENIIKDKISQETSTATDSFLSSEEIHSLKEVFSEESNFDTEIEEIIEQNSSDYYTPLGKSTNLSEESLNRTKTVLTGCDILEKTKIINNSPQSCNSTKNVMNSDFSTTSGKSLLVKHEELKISQTGTNSEVCTEFLKTNNISDSFLYKSENEFDDTEKENINNFNTPKIDPKFVFSTTSGRKINVTEENLKKARNIFQDCAVVKDDLNTIQIERNFGSEQEVVLFEKPLQRTENCDTLKNNIESPINASNYGVTIASNKEVDISEKPLKKVINVLHNFGTNHSGNSKNLSSIGFATASGNKVAVSEDALNKAKNIFQDCDITEEILDKNIETPKNASFGFATASGMKVAISEETLKKTKNIFQDCDIAEEILDKNIETPKNASFGFATASGNKVAISAESLKKAKNIFQDCDITEENLDRNIETPKDGSSLGFATASGNQVAISEDSLKRAKNIFQNCDITEEILDKNIETPKSASSFGFATASGKQVAISEDSLRIAKNIFQDCDIIEEILDKNIETPKSASSFGFATASGKQVAISEDSLRKAKNIFQDCDITEEILDKNIETPKSASSFGFATASGKQVAISEDSLRKAKNIFQDCDITEEILDKNIETPKSASSFGFATASGKQVAISEDSLRKAKNIFQDCDITEEILNKNLETPKSLSSLGFATASGKQVAISEDSLRKAKNIFQDCDITEEILDKNLDTPKSASSLGFATASGKQVAISEDSLRKAKNMFQDCDNTEEILDKNLETPKSTSFGFATASGKKVAISEEALEKAKSVFDKVNETNNEQSFAEYNRELVDSHSTPTTLRNKVMISDEASNKARNLFEDNAESIDFSSKEESQFDCATTSINVSEKSLKKNRSISESSGETRSMLSTPKNDKLLPKNIFEHKMDSNQTIRRTNSSSAVTANKSYSTPQISTNNSTPVLRNKTLSARNSKKRSLGVTSCRQIDIPDNIMKRAKLVFDEIDSPKKKETTINNNHLQNYSPLAHKTNTPVVKSPQNVTSRSTPNIPTPSKSLLNSTITMKESNQHKSLQNLSVPKISPIKRLCLGNENMLDNSSFVFQEGTSGDLKKWNIDLQKELEMLKLKMSVIETRMQMLNKQQEIIESGSSDHRRQRPGCLFAQKSKSDNRISLKTAVKCRRPEKNTHQICLNMGLDPSLLDITAENSSSLHFHVPWWPNDKRTYPAVIRTEDGTVVIPNQQNFVGSTEIERAFLAMPGVDPSLVAKKWVSNHYRWIVWKLASMERNYPNIFKNCLTVESVINQLKYRYDREIDRAQRPALRKIVECDDTAAKRIVLCIAAIFKLEDNKYELELTDGWYSIRTLLDAPLNSLVERNVIKVGMKLVTQGAELQNCEGCCPLELSANVRLQINYNSTRRAAWDIKLGYQPNPGPLLIALRMVAGNGGPVGGVRAYIARVYPISFMERCEASITWRNQRAELRRANQWEAEYANTMETMQMHVQQELEREWGETEKKNRNKRLKIKDVKGVLCGRTLYQFMEDSNDPDSVKEMLTSAQISALQDYQAQLNMERQAELTSRLRQKLSSEKIQPRNVSTVLKLLLVDVQSPYHHRMMSVWRSTESHTQLLKEDVVISIYNVAAKNNGTLSSIPRTQFDVDSDFDTAKFENTNRFIIPISQTANPELKLQFGEFDTIGIVVTIDVQQTAQTFWLADENYRFLMVKIREGPETCLFDGIMPGKVVAVMNLLYQKPFKSYGEAVANHYTVLSSYPQQAYLQDFMKEFIENLSESQDVEQYLEECKNQVEQLSVQNLKRCYVLNPLKVNNSEEEIASFSKKLCGIENTQQNKSDSLTLSDEEMALIDTQVM